MSGSDRRKYLTATVLDQGLLDWCADNEDNKIEAVIEIGLPVDAQFDIITITSAVSGHTYTITVSGVDYSYLAGGSDVTATIAHGLQQLVEPSPALATASANQIFLTAASPGTTYTVSINSDPNMSLAGATIPAFIYASDRHKYIVTDGVGIFYQAMLVFPEILRTLGEWLVPELEFSTLQIEHSNADSRFNVYLVGGTHYAPFVNRTVAVKVGLAELGSSYVALFRGVVTEAAGSSRSIKSFKLVARDLNAAYDVQFPNTNVTPATFPFVEDSISGKILPVIYGDWTIELEDDPNLEGGGPSAEIPSYPVNGTDPNVIGGTRTNVEVIISDHALKLFDAANVYLVRGSNTYLAPSADVTNVAVNNNAFEVKQNTGTAWVAGAPYLFQAGDVFAVRVKGYDLGSYDNNAVEQARHILETYGGLSSGNFHANWDTYRDKSTPSQSAIANIVCRVHLEEANGAVAFARSLLAQVRLEAFFDREDLFKINALHFEDWAPPDAAVLNIENRDVEENTFEPAIDEKNNFNRAQGFYKRSPIKGEETRQTRVQRNQAAIDQIDKEISRHIDFPNLIFEADVKNQVVEILRLASATIETPAFTTTWRAILRDMGEFMTLNIKIGSVQLDNVPCMIREIRYNPQGFKLPMRVWSFAMCPYPGYTPGYAGTVGGYNAVIDEE